MPSEHEQLIREGYAAINRRDSDWLRAHAHPDLEFRSRFSALSGRSYSGERAFEDWLADASESWESMEQTPERFIEVDPDRTIAEIRFKARGRESQVEVDQLLALAFTFRGEQVIRAEAHDSVEDALEAVGGSTD
jgi:ketosteroid isomerase-like protein